VLKDTFVHFERVALVECAWRWVFFLSLDLLAEPKTKNNETCLFHMVNGQVVIACCFSRCKARVKLSPINPPDS
jgi:hypothetical protein